MNPIEMFLIQMSALHITSGALLIIYLAAVNVIAFLAMGRDKKKARRGEWRTPEATLFLLAIIGGSIGSNLGMFVFHHKTRKRNFRIGMPAILVAQLLLVLLIVVMTEEVVFL